MSGEPLVHQPPSAWMKNHRHILVEMYTQIHKRMRIFWKCFTMMFGRDMASTYDPIETAIFITYIY